MTNSSSSLAKIKIENQLTCPVCLGRFTEPRTLPCLHSFCTKCLEKILLFKDNAYSISCPTCSKIAVLSEQGVVVLPKALCLDNLIEVHDLLKKASSEEKNITAAVCGNCSKETATLYCQECDRFICHTCNDFHKGWSPLSTHEVISINEISLGKHLKKCLTHTGQQLDLYCITCEQPICYHCTVKGHKGHDHDLVSDAYDNCKMELLKRIELIDDKIKEKSVEIAEADDNKVNAHEEGDKLKSAVNNLCDKFVQKLEELRALGLQLIDTGVSTLMKWEDQLIKNVKTDLEALKSCKKYVEHALKINMPAQLLTTKEQVMARIDKSVGHQLIETTNKSSSMSTTEIVVMHSKDKKTPLCTMFEFIQDNAINNLKDKIFSYILFKFPKEVYRQSECIMKLPKSVGTNSKSTATFTLLYQGQPLIINKEHITCSCTFVHEIEDGDYYDAELDDYFSEKDRVMRKKPHITCHVDYFVDKSSLQYQIAFTTSSCPAGKYNFKLKIDKIIVTMKGNVLTVGSCPSLHKKNRKWH